MTDRAYKYRFYPTPGQKIVLAQTFGCARYVYNWALDYRTQTYRACEKSLNYYDLSRALTEIKRQPETDWLCEVSCVPLQQVLRHQERAFRNFFDGRAGYPKFKKKHHRQSLEYTRSAFSWDGERLTLAKMPGHLDIRWARHFGAQPTTVTVSRDQADRYFVSFRVKQDIQPKPVTPHRMGVDLGLSHIAIFSSGQKVGNPRFLAKDASCLKRAQCNLSRKKPGSKNREKARKKVARIHARITDRRNDFLHKLTTGLIHENQVICAESLRVKNMVKHPHLSKAISDVGWSELTRQLAYKAQWYGRTFVQIDTFFPSSKTCSQCGHGVDFLPLEMRTWTCPECRAQHDRDINAAKNILAEGLSVTACGETVRPTKALSLVGASL